MGTRPLLVGLAALAAAGSALAAPAGASTGQIHTVAGNGTAGYAGNGGPAKAAELFGPRFASMLASGGYLISDSFNCAIRRVSPAGTVSTAAGSGPMGCMFGGDGGLAISADLDAPRGVAPLSGGGFLIGDFANQRVRMVNAAGKIFTIAGDGTPSYGGDNGPARDAQVNYPRSVRLLPGSGYLIGSHIPAPVVRKVASVSGSATITTVAGTGGTGNTGNGGSATAATFNTINDILPLPGGGFLIADGPSDVVRKVKPNGIIVAFAGNGTSGYSGDGGPATSAELDGPRGLALLPDGGVLIADHNNNVIREVTPAGRIRTVAGNGTPGFGGDGGDAKAAELNGPEAVSATPNGGYLIVDADNQRIRFVEGPNAIRLGKLRRHRAKGTAALFVKIPGPGKLILSGKGLKRSSKSKRKPGLYKLQVIPRGAARATLERARRLVVKARVRFLPGYTDPSKPGPRLPARRKARKLTLILT